MKTLPRLIILSAFLLATTVAAAQKAPSTPIQLNDYLASVNDSLYILGTAWGTQMGTAFQAKDYTSLTPFRKKLEEHIERKKDEIKKLKDIGDSKNLRMVFMAYLDFEMKMVKEGFLPLEKFTSTSTDDEVKAAIGKLTDIAGQEGNEIKKLHAAQQEYAAKNGFSVQKEGESEGN